MTVICIGKKKKKKKHLANGDSIIASSPPATPLVREKRTVDFFSRKGREVEMAFGNDADDDVVRNNEWLHITKMGNISSWESSGRQTYSSTRQCERHKKKNCRWWNTQRDELKEMNKSWGRKSLLNRLNLLSFWCLAIKWGWLRNIVDSSSLWRAFSDCMGLCDSLSGTGSHTIQRHVPWQDLRRKLEA